MFLFDIFAFLKHWKLKNQFKFEEKLLTFSASYFTWYSVLLQYFSTLYIKKLEFQNLIQMKETLLALVHST